MKWVIVALFFAVESAFGIQATLPEFEFVEIPAGSYTAGSGNYYPWKQNENWVDVTYTQPFELQTTLVTQLQWYQVMGTNPSNDAWETDCPGSYIDINLSKGICADFPVTYVSWYDVQDFIAKINALDPYYSYRLPTEGEWEYATRAGTTTPCWYGDCEKDADNHAWYYKNSNRKTHPVKANLPNPWGLYDMSGHIWEWMHNVYADTMKGGVNPPASSPKDQWTPMVMRGGSSWLSSDYLRSANRNGIYPYQTASWNGNSLSGELGFRLVRSSK